uniref:Prokineticin 2 n=1 Tax=Hucho hucho TaxID=62062 RepID=A0A4W5RNG0_9TELE
MVLQVPCNVFSICVVALFKIYSVPVKSLNTPTHSRVFLYLYYFIHCRIIACEKDSQCGGGMCCAVSLWIQSLRMCAPMGQEGDECHCLSHKVPFFGKRLHHTCPCLPNLILFRLRFAKDNLFFLLKNMLWNFGDN